VSHHTITPTMRLKVSQLDSYLHCDVDNLSITLSNTGMPPFKNYNPNTNYLRWGFIFMNASLYCETNRIGGVMVIVSSVVDRVFEPRPGQTKDYKIDICCFSANHAAFRRKSKDWLARNQDNVS